MGGFVSDALIGQHFTDIVMHETGHALGLRHNFAASSQVSRSQLRDDAFVHQHGLATSIMDYVPVNIFSDLSPAAAATHTFFMTTIGTYDRAAIAYGYSVALDEVPGEKSPTLTALARNTPFFLTDEDADMTASPYGQRFDLSDDPVDFASDRLALVKRLRDSRALRKIPFDAPWTVRWRREAALLYMINSTVDTLVPLLGGVNVSHAHRDHNETTYAPAVVPRATQRKALDVLKRILQSDRGLFPAPADYASYIRVFGEDWEVCGEPSLEYGCLARGLVDLDSVILKIQRTTIARMLFPTIVRIVAQDVRAPVSVLELLDGLRDATASVATKSKDDNDPNGSRAKVLRAYLVNMLQAYIDCECADVRVTEAIASVFPDIVAATHRDGFELTSFQFVCESCSW